jgi:hypothetical protein
MALSPYAQLRVFAVDGCPGWDCVESWLLVRGRLRVGQRTSSTATNKKAPAAVLQTARNVAASCRNVRLRAPERIVAGKWLHPITDDFGLDRDLVALADKACGPGGWRIGGEMDFGDLPFVAIKVKAGDVVAVLAPMRRR